MGFHQDLITLLLNFEKIDFFFRLIGIKTFVVFSIFTEDATIRQFN